MRGRTGADRHVSHVRGAALWKLRPATARILAA